MSRPASVSTTRLVRTTALVATVALVLPGAATARTAVTGFEPVATYEVTGEVAEIAAVTPDGRTVLYTDSEEREIGFVDISDPSDPTADGEVEVDGSPTSVAVTKDGRYALAVVDTTDGDYPNPSGYLAAIDIGAREIVDEWELGGQPDSIAVAPSGKYAAIAIENQRDEELDPDGDGVGEPEGGLPQTPAGWLTIVDLATSPSAWGLRTVSLAGLPGLRFPTDPEPEFIDIAPNDTAAITLQENNAVALVDLKKGAVTGSWSAGTATHAADLTDDDDLTFTETLTARREPDSIGWTPAGTLATANEGDYPTGGDGIPGGSRDFTVFDPAGAVVYEPGAAFEQAIADAGLYNDGRSDNRGAEPEGLEVGKYTGATFLFVAAERADGVVVHRIRGTEPPQLVQVLETGSRPEGLVAVPSRNLFVTANEGDGTISIFQAVSGS